MWRVFSRDELSHLAARARLPTRLVIHTARDTVARFQDRWQADNKHLPIAIDAVTPIEAHMKRISPVNSGAATRVDALDEPQESLPIILGDSDGAPRERQSGSVSVRQFTAIGLTFGSG